MLKCLRVTPERRLWIQNCVDVNPDWWTWRGGGVPACFLELFSSTSAADSVSKIPAYKNQSTSGTSQCPEPACMITSLVACEVWAHRVLSLEGFQTQVQCCGSYSCTASAPELVMATHWGGFVKHPITVRLVVRRNQPCSPLICEDLKVQGLQPGWQPSVLLPACARCFLEMA